MRTRTLPREEWAPYLAAQAPRARAARADIHVLDPERERFALAWGVPLLDLAYDPHADRLVVRAVDLEHPIEGPRSVAVLEGPAGDLRGLEVVAGDGIRHVVAIHEVLALGG